MNFVHDDPDFAQLLAIVARDTGVDAALVEKDYWVTHCLWAVHRAGLELWFKGGTSLSKGFGLIQRFSEDLDLMVHHGSVVALPPVSSWASTNKGPVAERRAFYDALPAAFAIPAVKVAVDEHRRDKYARGADFIAHYPGVLLGQLPGEVVLAFRAQISAADAVLIAAPEYAGAISGVVKNALDWIVGSGDLYGKPVALLSAGTSGLVFARRDLVRTLSWQGAHVVASLGIDAASAKSVRDSDGSPRFTNPTFLDEIGALASSLVASVAQRPSERFAAVAKLALDAGVEQDPLADHIAAQDQAWFRR